MTAHFDAFGVLCGKVIRRLNSGSAIDMAVLVQEVGAGASAGPARHKRFPPRNPGSTLTLGDDTEMVCFIIDLPIGSGDLAEMTPENRRVGCRRPNSSRREVRGVRSQSGKRI